MTVETTTIDHDRLMAFIGQVVSELGATVNAGLIVIGDRLGLYRALASAGPLSPAELATRTGTAERYVREWLNAQAAGGYVEYDPTSGRYGLTPEKALALADESSPAFVGGAFQLAQGSLKSTPEIERAFKPAAGTAGTSTTWTCTSAVSASSGPATTPTCSRPGCRPWRG